MELLLKKDVEKLGRRGEVVKVSDGYARNFLIPKGIAVAVSKGNLKQIEMEKKKLEKEEKLKIAAVKEFAERLKAYSCTISAQANEEGNLFGSVTTAMIIEAMAKDGFSLDERQIVLENAIKELGVYTIPVRIDDNLQSEFKLWVVGQ